MTEAKDTGDIEGLLPWLAAGTLSREEAGRVEAALARDPELARRYALVREEFAETVRLNEALRAPSPKALDRLMGRIEAEPARDLAGRSGFALRPWLERLLVRLSPRTLAWSAAAAAILVLVQAGVLAALLVGSPGQSYRTASVDQPQAAGAYALIGFVPQASAADVTQFLETYQASIVDGPRAGGLYRVRIGEGDLSRDDRAKIVGRMQRETGVVRFAAPAD